MPSYNVHEAKAQFSRLLDLVLQGEAVVITRNGVPVAELVPARNRPFPLVFISDEGPGAPAIDTGRGLRDFPVRDRLPIGEGPCR